MSKVFGNLADFDLVKEDASRYIIGYDLEPTANGKNYTWCEIYFSKKQGKPDFAKVKQAILNDINSRTDANILTGFTWENQPVYLSTENQFNYKVAYDLAVQTQGQSLPVTFKLGEDSDGNPIYHTFSDMVEFNNFYISTISYVNMCLNEGWEKKDSIDFDEYKPYFPESVIKGEEE